MFGKKLELGTQVYFADITGEDKKYTIEIKTGKVISIGNKKYILEVEGGPNKLLDAKLISKNIVYLKLAHQLPLSTNEKLEYQHITGNWE